MGFSRQEYWSGLPFPSPGDLPNPGIEPGSPALEADALTSEPPGKPPWNLGWDWFCPAPQAAAAGGVCLPPISPDSFPSSLLPDPHLIPSQDSETVLCGSQNHLIRTEGSEEAQLLGRLHFLSTYSGWQGRPTLNTAFCPLRLTLGTSYDFSSPLDSWSHSSSMAQVPALVYASCSHYFHSLTWFPKSHSHTHTQNLFKRPKQTQTGALYQSRGVRWGRRWGGRFKRERIYVYLWLIQVEVWQKTTKFYKAIILQ